MGKKKNGKSDTEQKFWYWGPSIYMYDIDCLKVFIELIFNQFWDFRLDIDVYG